MARPEAKIFEIELTVKFTRRVVIDANDPEDAIDGAVYAEEANYPHHENVEIWGTVVREIPRVCERELPPALIAPPHRNHDYAP